jgi:hypothetical protein
VILKKMLALMTLLLAVPLAQASIIDFQDLGFLIPSDCASPLPPQPLCVVVHAEGIATAVGGDVPGSWKYTADGQGLFGVGGGTWDFDDLGPGNNDLFGTFTISFSLPDALGVVTADIGYLVTGGHGIFEGMTGSGESVDKINASPPSSPLGAFTEVGELRIPEPPVYALLAVGLFALGFAGRRRRD